MRNYNRMKWRDRGEGEGWGGGGERERMKIQGLICTGEQAPWDSPPPGLPIYTIRSTCNHRGSIF